MVVDRLVLGREEDVLEREEGAERWDGDGDDMDGEEGRISEGRFGIVVCEVVRAGSLVLVSGFDGYFWCVGDWMWGAFEYDSEFLADL